MKFPKLLVTHEHGSWAVLLVPMVVAVGVTGRFSWDELLVAVAAVSVFMSYIPFQTILRHLFVQPQPEDKLSRSDFWAAVFSLISVSAGILLLSRGYWLLIPLALAAGACFLANFLLVRRFRKGVSSDLVAVAGLTATAPAVVYVATSRLGPTAISLWILNFLFFGSSVFYVHMKLLASGMKKDAFSFAEKITIGRLNVLYHVVVVAIVLILTLVHLTPRLAVLAFIPMIVHALVGTFRLSSRVRFRYVGFALLTESIAFSFLLLLVARY